jgi:Domain of unknown function (DUF4142)
MNSPLRTLAAAVLCTLPMLLAAATAPTITDEEEHFLRGYFDRQSNAAALTRVALERGSDDVKKYAQSEMDMYQSFATGIVKLYDEFKLNTRPLAPGVMSPPLGFGVSRGLQTLPEGYSWASKNVAGFLSAGGGMPAGMGPPPGATPGGPGAAPSAGARAGGPAQARYDYDLATMKTLSGMDFDKAYALRMAIAHNAMLRHIASELTADGNNADMIAFAKSALKVITAQNSKLETLAAGQGLPAPRGGGPAPAGAAPAAGAPRPAG